MAVLSEEQVRVQLSSLPGWEVHGKAIRKQYTFGSFTEAIRFVNRVAEAAERADHHPDILVQYNRVTLTLSTHSEGGVTEKDLNLARRIEELAG